MIEIKLRDMARFRTAVQCCRTGHPKRLAPPIVLHRSQDALTLSAILDEMALALHLPIGAGPSERLVIPFSTLAGLRGNGRGIVTLESSKDGSVRCRWQERGNARELDCATVPGEVQAAELLQVGILRPVPPSLLTALHACGQTANRMTDDHLAPARLQLRGQDGAIAGTDGRNLLLWGGFSFPFPENVLVPAVPLFGSRELAGEHDIYIGRTGQHITIAAGAWTIWLVEDAASPYTDVQTLLPRSGHQVRLVIEEADAAALLRDLQRGTTAGDEVVAVVLDLSTRPALRWPQGTSGRRGPLNLIRSTYQGPALAVRLDPSLLVRALLLRFRELRCSSGQAPVLFRDQQRCFLVAPFGPSLAPFSASVEPQE